MEKSTFRHVFCIIYSIVLYLNDWGNILHTEGIDKNMTQWKIAENTLILHNDMIIMLSKYFDTHAAFN